MKKKLRGLSGVLLALILVFTMLAHPFGAFAMETAKNGGTPENAAQREAWLQEDRDLTAPSDGEAEDKTADPEFTPVETEPTEDEAQEEFDPAAPAEEGEAESEPAPEETEATEDSSQEEPDHNVSSDNRQGENYAAAVEKDGAVTYFDSFSTAADGANWVAGSTLRLMADATVSSTVSVPSGKHSLDLNGHALKAGSTGYSVVTVGSGAELIVDDTSGSSGKITGGSVGQNYGGGVTVDGGTLTLKGGAISGNANTYGGIGNCGGGVHVRSGGKFYMEGGEISGNTSYVGGGICTDSSAATVNITGGVIKNNQTERFGSAIWAGRSSSAVFRIGGTAQIIDNISKWTSDKDGEGTLNTGSTYLLSGDPTVHGDWKTNGQSSPNTHINLDNDGSGIQCITLEGALTNTTGTPKLTVTPLYRWNDLKNGQTFTFTKNWSSYMGTAHPADYFKVDGSVSGIRVIRKNGEAAFTGGSDLGDLYVTYDANGGAGTMEPLLITGTSASLAENTFTRENYKFIGWNTKADGSGTEYADKAAVTLTGDLKLYAQWEKEEELFEGQGTADQPYLIQSADDWDALSSHINGGGTTYDGKYFKLTNDISVTTVLGNRPNTSTDSNDNVFSGTFDGGGHTLTVNISDPVFAAPFAIAHNATIKNLNVTGSVTSTGNHATGLVGASKGKSIYDDSSLLIQNVTVSVSVSCNSHVAGIVGHAHKANITMENVVFDGSMSASSVQGGFIGWGGISGGAGFTASFKDCLFTGTYRSGAAFYPVAFASGQGTATLVNDFYTTSLGSGGSPISPTGSGQVKLLAAAVEKNGAVTYFDSLVTASDSANWTTGSTLRLMADANTSSVITVPSGSRTLDLNGKTITRTGASGSDNSGLVMTIGNGVDLTITGPGKITGGKGFHGGGIHVEGSGSLVLDNCEISGNAGHYGGGLYLKNGTITLKNGTVVKENSASEGFGGSGIYAEGGGTLIMDGSTFTGNEIKNNNQYAVFLCGNAKLQVSGTPVIYDNTYNGTQKNLYLYQSADQDSKVQIVGSLTEGTHIGVAQVNVTGVFTSDWTAYMGSADPSKYFTSDNSSYQIFLNGSGEAAIGTPPVASVISGGTATDYGTLSDAVNAWTAGSTLKLMTDVTTSSTVNVPSGEHTLDLNGYGILMTGNDRVITINQNASLELNDSDPDRIHYITLTNYRGTAVSDSGEESVSNGNGVIKVTGGYLTGGYRNNSGSHDRCGAGVYNWGTFVMNGGSIVGNTLFNNSGGGIRNSGYFTMNGGTIAFNYASGNGGGVTTYVPGGSQGKMTMNGGEISDNYCGSYGGGIQIAGPIEMTGGSVVRNTAGSGGSGVFYDGKNDRFKLSGNPVIKDNSNKDDLYLGANATFMINGSLTEETDIHVLMNTPAEFTVGWKNIMGNADPSKYFTSDNDSYQVFLNDNGEAEIGAPPAASVISGDTTTSYAAFSDAVNAWTAGSTLKLLTDVTTSSTVNVPSGAHTLDLNGHGIKMTGSGSVLNVGSSTEMILNDSNPEAEHKFTVSNARPNGAGLATVNDGLTSDYQTFTGGYITGGSAQKGGGILVQSGGSLTLNGGAIIGNQSSFMGGGIKIDNDSTFHEDRFIMNGGAVMYNTVSGWGAGICSDDSVKMTGGTVAYNYATNNPGGIHCHYLYLSGGRVEYNYAGATDYAAGAHADHEVFISGSPVIANNVVNGAASNLDWDRTEYRHGHKLNLTGALTEEAKLSVTMRVDGYGVFTSGWKTYMGSADPTEYFTSDNADYEVRLENGEAILSYPYVSGFSASGFEGDYDGEAHGLTVTVPEGVALQFGTTEGEYKLAECPTYTDAGTYTVYYQATQDNHLPVAGSATIQIAPINATVTVTGNTASADYDGEVHSVSGYEAVASTPLYDVTKDFTFSGNAKAVRINAGTSDMGLAPEQFENVNANFAEVTFDVTDGGMTIDPIDVTVTITGHNGSAEYDGEAHSVSGYDVEIGNALYKASYFSFSGDATATRTERGRTEMGLSAEQFTNNNANFTVTFDVTDGSVTITPIDATVTIIGETVTADYDGNEHSVIGYTASVDVALYDVSSDFVFTGSASAAQTDAGTANMGLKAEQFVNTNENFGVVVFVVTDGYVTVNPIDASVTITGHTEQADYDGEAHSVSGYDAVASTSLYDVTKDFTFSGSAEATQTDAGTANMGLTADQFTNTNANFATVTFNVTDGYVTVDPIDVTVTITGHTEEADYDGESHSVSGYDVEIGSALYTESDFTFSGTAEAARVDAGTTEMGLAPEQFANVNANFATVTFDVTDGGVTIRTVDAVITTAPVSAEPVYDGAEQALVVAGEAEGGTLCYAMGDDPENAPAADRFAAAVPTAQETGIYYVWYMVAADSNHNDLSPVCVKVVLTDETWVTLSGTLTESDGTTPLTDAVVTLMQGDQVVDYVATDSSGNYQFTVPAGVYSVLVENGTSSSTTIAKVFEDTVLDLHASDGKTESLVILESSGDDGFEVAVGGLSEEADIIRANNGLSSDDALSLVMTVELKTTDTAKYGDAFSDLLETKSFMFFDITIKQTIGSETTVMDTTTSVLEIVVPYEKTNRADLTVYSSDGSGIRYFRQSDSKEAGTFRIDKENGYIFIYADSFATFAIGYTPHYSLNSTATLGSFNGTVSVVITSNMDGSQYTLNKVFLDRIRFADIPKGSYTMTITWEDGATNTLTVPLKVS